MGSGKIRVTEVLGELYTIVHLFQVYLRDEESETKKNEANFNNFDLHVLRTKTR